MKVLVQRVKKAEVRILSVEEGSSSRRIGAGLLVLLGVEVGDLAEDVAAYVARLAGLRIFNDSAGKMNLSLQDIQGECLVVSNFSLAADTRRGRRPSFVNAAPPEVAKELYLQFCRELEQLGIQTKSGVFRAAMEVESINDGPITILLDPPASVARRTANDEGVA